MHPAVKLLQIQAMQGETDAGLSLGLTELAAWSKILELVCVTGGDCDQQHCVLWSKLWDKFD